MWFDQHHRVREHQEQLRREAASWRLARVADRGPTRWTSALKGALRHASPGVLRQVGDGSATTAVAPRGPIVTGDRLTSGADSDIIDITAAAYQASHDPEGRMRHAAPCAP
jgi:hypothetical protein